MVLLVLVLVRRRVGRRRARDASTAVQEDPEKAKVRVSRGTEPPPIAHRALILASDDHAEQLLQALPDGGTRVRDAKELVAEAAKHRSATLFVDVELLGDLPDLETVHHVVVGLIDATTQLGAIVTLLDKHPWLVHVIATPLLSQPLGRTHLKALMERVGGDRGYDLLGNASVGRVAVLATASHREARFERMRDYFSKHGLSSRTIMAIYEVTEELVMNALYNAPSESGYFKEPVSRTEDVTLPLDRACEISYGIEHGMAFARLRDTFGALRLERLREVLNRCNQSGVVLDESRGGAGLGMWRVFSAATTIAITVIPGRLTDILVRIAPKQGRRAKQLLAVDLFFLPNAGTEEQHVVELDNNMLDRSVTLIQPN
jgi:hypothetical protein